MDISWVTKKQTNMARRFLIYRTGNNIKITTLRYDSESFQAALEKYYEALSNFGCRPVQKIQFITTTSNHFRAKQYVDKNRKAILAMPIQWHTGSNMESKPYEGWDPLYERECPTCGSIGASDSWVRVHFDNCKHKRIEEYDQLDF
jgi:hypothetical protein